MDINIGTSVRGRTTLLRDRAFGYTAFKAYKSYNKSTTTLNRIYFGYNRNIVIIVCDKL